MFRKTENIWSQHFNMKGEQMVNERGLVFDVAGGKDVNNQKVIVWKSHKSLFLAFGTMAKDKSAKKEVVSREYTVNLGKMLHGWYVHLMDGMG